jgi:ankyrin repeat protein
LCRPFIKKRPQWLHQAINTNHLCWLCKFLPLASSDTLQEKNEQGESVLLHATRLNRINVVRELFNSKHFGTIVTSIDNVGNNMFHLLTFNTDSCEVLDELLEKLREAGIPTQQHFDQENDDHLTPLQCAIRRNNVSLTERFLKYFRTNIIETHNYTGDNLLHLAVRHADLKMVKCLIEQGKLIQCVNQSNLTETPMEMARSMENFDILEYFVQQCIPDDTSDDEDSDDTDDNRDDDDQALPVSSEP